MTRPAPRTDTTAPGVPAAYTSARCARFGPSTFRAAWWSLGAWRAVRARLPIDGMSAAVSPPPCLPVGATRGVLGVLRRVPATCLERCLVLQAWLLQCGEPYDVIVGVDATEDIQAHAWLPFESGEQARRFKELVRIPAQRNPTDQGWSGSLSM